MHTHTGCTCYSLMDCGQYSMYGVVIYILTEENELFDTVFKTADKVVFIRLHFNIVFS